VRDSVRTYLALATGVTLLTRDRALTLTRQVVNQGEATAGQVQALAEELLETSRNNREALIGLIRYEIDRAIGRFGFASADEVAALRARVRTLEAGLRALEVGPGRSGRPRSRPQPKRAADKVTSATGAP
jgi:polyhydroxyalkanoate synthesis regulator phasin